MNSLMMFEGNQVEVFELNGEVLFNPYHIGNCLNLSDSAVRMAMGKMTEKQVVKLKNSDVKDVDIRKLNNAGELFLTESGVYKLAFKSQKEEAERFVNWVSDEVLPSIRKSGYYVQDNEQTNINVVLGVISKIKDKEVLALVSALSQKTESLLQETKEQKHLLELQSPKVEFADHIENSEGSISVSSFAKLMSKKGINTGRNRMLNWLREQGYIGTTKKEYNQPKQIMINSGYMESEITTNQNNKNGKHIVKVVPMITGKGITYLSKKYLDFIKSHKIA